MNIIKNRRIWYIVSALLVAGSLLSILYFGLNLGIEFTGGSLLEVEYTEERPDIDATRTSVEALGFGNTTIQPTGERGLIVRARTITDEERREIITALSVIGETTYELQENRFDSIGPVIGTELRRKSITAIIVVVLLIIFFIAFAFRNVGSNLPKGTRGVSSFHYGFMAIVALIHDVIIPTGIFAILGAVVGAQVDLLFVTAMLAILGFSVNDTIVVFDRVRENLHRREGKDFEETVGMSLSQTISRSINTSLTTLVVLFALFFLGGEATRMFSLALIIGISLGTYSSIFLASPLLVTIQKFRARKS